MKRFLSILVLSLMVPSLLFAGEIPTAPVQSVTESAVTLPPISLQAEKAFQVAHLTDADREACRAEQAQAPRRSHSWDTFWDVHFGGYRWAWWALAGGILIAIHVNAD